MTAFGRVFVRPYVHVNSQPRSQPSRHAGGWSGPRSFPLVSGDSRCFNFQLSGIPGFGRFKVRSAGGGQGVQATHDKSMMNCEWYTQFLILACLPP